MRNAIVVGGVLLLSCSVAVAQAPTPESRPAPHAPSAPDSIPDIPPGEDLEDIQEEWSPNRGRGAEANQLDETRVPAGLMDTPAAVFTFTEGERTVTIKCADTEPTEQCVTAVQPLVEAILREPGEARSEVPQDPRAPLGPPGIEEPRSEETR